MVLLTAKLKFFDAYLEFTAIQSSMEVVVFWEDLWELGGFIGWDGWDGSVYEYI